MILRRLFIIQVLFFLIGHTQAQTRSDAVQRRAQLVEPFILESSRRYGIDPALLRTLCFLESRCRLDAVSPKGARGPMQLMPETANRYGVTNPHDPRQSIDAAGHYLNDLLVRFRGRVDLALAAYNAGEGTVEAYLSGRTIVLENGKLINPSRRVTNGIPPYTETQSYVRSALLLFENVHMSHSTFTSKRDFTLDAVIDSNPSKSLSSLPSPSLFVEIP